MDASRAGSKFLFVFIFKWLDYIKWINWNYIVTNHISLQLLTQTVTMFDKVSHKVSHEDQT